MSEILPLRPARTGSRTNAAEKAFTLRAMEKGWTVTKRGWPDFIAVKEGRIIAVEVKPTANGGGEFVRWLAEHGIETYLWNPQTGFKRINSASK